MRLNHSNCFPLKFMKFYRIVFFAENIQVTDSKLCIFFFSIRVFFTGTDVHRTAGEGRRPSFIPLYHFHPLTNIETFICMWDHYHVFLIATLVFTRLLLDEFFHLIELPFEWLIDDAMFVCLLDELILGFCYSDLTLETGGFELASTITLVLQANRILKIINMTFLSLLFTQSWIKCIEHKTENL